VATDVFDRRDETEALLFDSFLSSDASRHAEVDLCEVFHVQCFMLDSVLSPGRLDRLAAEDLLD